MYGDDDLLPISALQHLLFCARQCALIHVEGVWAENRFTAAGRILHDRVHEAASESRGDVRVVRGLRLVERELGLVGVADVVEFRRAPPDAPAGQTAILPGSPGRWVVFPVEYKRGRPKPGPYDRVQFCAQALCLESMLGVSIPKGALYYGRPRHRTAVAFDEALRNLTRDTARRLHELIRSGTTPPPEHSAKCRSCSLKGVCLPKATRRRKAAAYTRRTIDQLLSNPPGDSIP